jgi:hypothetical protein
LPDFPLLEDVAVAVTGGVAELVDVATASGVGSTVVAVAVTAATVEVTLGVVGVVGVATAVTGSAVVTGVTATDAGAGVVEVTGVPVVTVTVERSVGAAGVEATTAVTGGAIGVVTGAATGAAGTGVGTGVPVETVTVERSAGAAGVGVATVTGGATGVVTGAAMGTATGAAGTGVATGVSTTTGVATATGGVGALPPGVLPDEPLDPPLPLLGPGPPELPDDPPPLGLTTGVTLMATGGRGASGVDGADGVVGTSIFIVGVLPPGVPEALAIPRSTGGGATATGGATTGVGATAGGGVDATGSTVGVDAIVNVGGAIGVEICATGATGAIAGDGADGGVGGATTIEFFGDEPDEPDEPFEISRSAAGICATGGVAMELPPGVEPDEPLDELLAELGPGPPELLELSLGDGGVVVDALMSIVSGADAAGCVFCVGAGASVVVLPLAAGGLVGGVVREFPEPEDECWVDLPSLFEFFAEGLTLGSVRGLIHPAAESCEMAVSMSKARDRKRKVSAPWLACDWVRRSSDSL